MDNKKKINYSNLDFRLLNSIFGISRGIKLYNSKLLLLNKNKRNNIYVKKIKKKFENENKEFIKYLYSIFNKRKLLKEKKERKRKIFESILNFKDCNNKIYNYRYLNQEKRFAFIQKIENIILIQSSFRSYQFRKNFYQKITEALKNKMIKSVIKIQTFIRQKFAIKNVKLSIIENLIENNFKKNKEIITKKFLQYYNVVTFKKIFLLNLLLEKRRKSIIKIQSYIKMRSIYQQIHYILYKMKTNYTITYPFFAHDVKIEIYILMNSLLFGKFGDFKFSIRSYNFDYYHILDMFILFIQPKELEKGKYRCQLIVDNCVTCDGRFPHIEFSDGKFYNLINFSLTNNVNNYDDNEQESPSEMEEKENNSNKSLNNGLKHDNNQRDDFSAFEDLRTNLESNIFESKMEFVRESSFKDLIDFN